MLFLFFCVLLCKEKYVTGSNLANILNPLLEDLMQLEQAGIDIDMGENIKGSISCIIGDNLGSNWLGGFVTNFSTANYVCRFCLASRHEFLTFGHERASLRTINSYNGHVSDMNQHFNSNVMGVKCNSYFNILKYFHVCSPGLPPCLAHDLFEGVVATDIVLFINHFVSKSWFDMDFLNGRISSFPYSKTEARSKPVLLRLGATKLGGNASQNWCLLRLFPLLIYGKIEDTEDEVWVLLLKLRSIVEGVCAPCIDSDGIAMISRDIQDYFDLYRSCFPNSKILPKHHYIMQFGPLINVWTLRFESKHSYFKEVLRQRKNFKNVALTLSRDHQIRQAYLLETGFIKDDLIFNQTPCVDVSQEVYAALCENNVTLKFLVQNVTYKGTDYNVGQYVVLSRAGIDLELGYLISLVVGHSLALFFVLQPCFGKYQPDLGVFEICTRNANLFSVNVLDLTYFIPLSCHHINGKNFLTLKHIVL